MHAPGRWPGIAWGDFMNRKLVAGLLLPALALTACSSKPREFRPTLAAPTAATGAANPAELDAAYAECRQLMVEGKLDSEGRLASGAAGVAATGATMAAGAAAATSAGLMGGAAIASATVVLLPFALIGGAVGMAKIKRANKEKAIKKVMTGCLAERGYTVAGWTKAGKAPKVVEGQEAAAADEAATP